LEARGIQTNIHYPTPIHKQAAYKNLFGNISLKKTEEYSRQILSLPIHNYLSQKQIVYVCQSIKEFFKRN
jgi:dTDP-4-amino-4,6-dideoxygalactose transaminase